MSENALKRNTKRNRDQKNNGVGSTIFMILPRVLGLGFRLGLFYLGFKRKAKKAGKIFEKELIAGGMDKKMARKLKEDYMQTSHLFRNLRIANMDKY